MSLESRSDDRDDGVTEGSASIVARMVAVMRALGPVQKDRKSHDGKYFYRGVDAIVNAVAPLLAEHGIVVAPRVVSRERWTYVSGQAKTEMHACTLTVAHRFYAEDGSWLEVVTVAEASDSADKAAAKAMTIAYRDALTLAFCIPTGDDEVDDERTPPRSEPQKPRPQTPPPQAKPITEAQLAAIRAAIGKRVDALRATGWAEGLTADEIELDLCSRGNLARLADLHQGRVAKLLELVAGWMPREPEGGA